MDKLGKKRLDAVGAIARYAASGSAVSAAPILGGKMPKQIVLTASDILMYTSIWRIYFEEDLSRKELLQVMTELGLITVAGAGTAYLALKASNLILTEITDWFGPVGWGVSAAITGSLTGLMGLTWISLCDRAACAECNRLYTERELESASKTRSA